jgi:uncharacterized protein YndB with AHSA1/START domain
MNETVTTEVELDVSAEQAWERITDPAWLGERGDIPTDVGAEGEVVEEGELRVLVVEEARPPGRFVFRWASFDDAPSRVEITVVEQDGRSRVTIAESPLTPMTPQMSAARTHIAAVSTLVLALAA